jgi:hypothetical protein
MNPSRTARPCPRPKPPGPVPLTVAGSSSSKISTVWVARISGISCSRVSTTSRRDAASCVRTRSKMSCSPEMNATWSTSGMLST